MQLRTSGLPGDRCSKLNKQKPDFSRIKRVGVREKRKMLGLVPSDCPTVPYKAEEYALPRFLESACGFLSNNNHNQSAEKSAICVSQSDKFAGNVKCINDSTFEQEVLKSDLPVLLESWAPWCGHCRLMVPVLADLSRQYEGRLKIVTLNTDESPKTAEAYSIRGIPHMFLFQSGQVVEHVIGVASRQTLENVVNRDK
jgi:thioredoxin 1